MVRNRKWTPLSGTLKLRGALVLAIAAALLAVMMTPAKATHASPGSTTTAIVSLGDSFISGEAGRWQGNSLDITGTRDGTDRAASCLWIFCSYDAHRVYGSSYDNGCDRSDVSTINSAAISVNKKINLACSGATDANIWRASQGGQSFKGEAPQADQLLTVAQNYNVKLVVLTISANDFGFSDRVINCTLDWIAGTGPCNSAEQAAMNSLQPAAQAGLAKAIDEIRAVMAQAGYSTSQYRLVLSGYTSPVPVASQVRYQGSDRWWDGGCPFYDADFNWAKTGATPFIVNSMKTVAAQKGVQFLDVQEALDGHELCNIHDQLVSSSPNPVTAEWVRWINTGITEGDAQESAHPNAYGQKAIGKCLQLIYGKASTSGNWSCYNTPGQSYTAMYLNAIP
jgi:hypothetical protein